MKQASASGGAGRGVMAGRRDLNALRAAWAWLAAVAIHDSKVGWILAAVNFALRAWLAYGAGCAYLARSAAEVQMMFTKPQRLQALARVRSLPRCLSARPSVCLSTSRTIKGLAGQTGGTGRAPPGRLATDGATAVYTLATFLLFASLGGG